MMTKVDTSNVVQEMMKNVFMRSDTNKSNSLDKQEFKATYEVLLSGTPVDAEGKPKVSLDEHFTRMDQNGDGEITEDEMATTPIAIPADICDTTLKSTINYLLAAGTPESIAAANLFKSDPAV